MPSRLAPACTLKIRHGVDLLNGVGGNHGLQLRRAHIEANGEISKYWLCAAEAGFVDNNVSLKDCWLGNQTSNGTRLIRLIFEWTLALETDPFSKTGLSPLFNRPSKFSRLRKLDEKPFSWNFSPHKPEKQHLSTNRQIRDS